LNLIKAITFSANKQLALFIFSHSEDKVRKLGEQALRKPQTIRIIDGFQAVSSAQEEPVWIDP
jgi:hypothetical protein